MADLLIDAIWRKCVGQCIAQDCGRLFISRERYDEHIAPLIERAEKAEREVAGLRAEQVLMAHQVTEWSEIASEEKRDAERYRWLRMYPNHYFPEEENLFENELDAAIDIALKEPKND